MAIDHGGLQVPATAATEAAAGNRPCWELGCGSVCQRLPLEHVLTQTVLEYSRDLLQFAQRETAEKRADLQAFGSSVALHFYDELCTTKLQQDPITGRKQASKLDFWRQDLLGGLLMGALIVRTSGSLARHPDKMESLADMAASIDFNIADVDSSFLAVPGVAAVTTGSKWQWLHLLWNLLTMTIRVDKHKDSTGSRDVLLTKLFAAFVAGSQVRHALDWQVSDHLWHFWRNDALASSLVRLLKRYVRTKLAVPDAQAIQQWLMCHTPAATTAQLPRQPSQEDLSQSDAPNETQQMHIKHIDSEDLRQAVSDHMCGRSLSDLAELEQQIVDHYEASSCKHL